MRAPGLDTHAINYWHQALNGCEMVDGTDFDWILLLKAVVLE